MVKIKYNADKDTYTVKGLTYDHLSVIDGLLNHTTLGTSGASKSAADLAIALEAEGIDSCTVKVVLEDDGFFAFEVE